MKPKDLLEHLEKGDRTMEMLRTPEAPTDMRSLAEQIGSLSNAMAMAQQSGAALGQYYQSAQNIQYVQGGTIQPRQGYQGLDPNPFQARYW